MEQCVKDVMSLDNEYYRLKAAGFVRRLEAALKKYARRGFFYRAARADYQSAAGFHPAPHRAK
jgi:hypothetical protein